jgi:hypothetical protein
VRQEEVAVVAGGRVDAVLAEQARPRVRHQPSELVALLLVTGVVDVSSAWGPMLRFG